MVVPKNVGISIFNSEGLLDQVMPVRPGFHEYLGGSSWGFAPELEPEERICTNAGNGTRL